MIKKFFVGASKALLYIITLILAIWAVNGFNILTNGDVATVLAVGAIVEHFMYKEYNNNK